MRRRVFVLVPMLAPAALRAAEDRPAIEVLTAMASSLSERNAVAFMAAFDPAMPGIEALRANVAALLAQAEVLSSIEPLRDEGDDARRTIEVDWFLQISAAGRIERRRATVTCRIERHGKKWLVASLEPRTLFAPPAR